MLRSGGDAGIPSPARRGGPAKSAGAPGPTRASGLSRCYQRRSDKAQNGHDVSCPYESTGLKGRHYKGEKADPSLDDKRGKREARMLSGLDGDHDYVVAGDLGGELTGELAEIFVGPEVADAY